MKQRSKNILLAFLMFLASVGVMADQYDYDFEVDGIRYAKINNTKVKVVTKWSRSGTNKDQYKGDIVIPETVQNNGNSYRVTAIGERAFECAQITSISLPETIKTIEPSAFKECELSSITLPESIDSIGYFAFLWCRNLEKVNIPEGITYISNQTFELCPIKTIHIPDNVKSIGYRAFANCRNLLSVTGMLGVISIGEEAFMKCTNLTSIVIRGTVKTIKEETFSGCVNLKDVTISEGVQRIEDDAFYNCKSLTEILIPASLTKIDYNPFRYCSNLATIKVATDNPKFDSRDDCNAIMSSTNDIYGGIDMLIVGCNGTVIPKSTKKIYGAFYGSTLSQVRIPAGLTSLDMFWDCYIGEINVEEGNPIYDSRNNCNAVVITESNTIHTVSSKTFIPQDIVEVQGDFRPYTEMNALYCYANTPPEIISYFTTEQFTTEQFQNITVFVPKGSKSAYEKAKVWDNFWNIKEFDTSGIGVPQTANTIEIKRYDINGQLINSLKKGINIVKMSDGTAKKVVVK